MRISASSLVLCSLFLAAAVGCKRRIPEPEPVAAPAPREEPKPKPAPAPVAPAPKPQPKPGWSEVTHENNLPLCAFASASERENTKAVAKVKQQLFKPDRAITFGVFARSCINPECDELASLQCSVERSGNTLRLQAKYAGLHKDGTVCADKCSDVRAACESPVLEQGEYTIEYGGTTIPLKLPSMVNMPCFK